MKILYLDTETTGLESKENCIIQVSGIIEIDGEEKETFNFSMRPRLGAKIEPEALKITGFTEDHIKGFPPRQPVYKSLIEIFGKYIDKFDKKDKFVFAGQNTKFDLDFMISFWNEFGDKYLGSYINYRRRLDLMYISSYLSVMGHIDIENNKLSTLAEYFEVKLDAHDALNDIKATKKILKKIQANVSYGSEEIDGFMKQIESMNNSLEYYESAFKEVKTIFEKTCQDCLIDNKCTFDKCATYKLKDKVEGLIKEL